MLTKTEAVVLKAVKYRETSKIVTLYTKKFGKINAVAKGAMLTTSKFGASLEPMSYILAVLYKKETREVQFLSQADLIKPFLSLYSDYNKMILRLFQPSQTLKSCNRVIACFHTGTTLRTHKTAPIAQKNYLF